MSSKAIGSVNHVDSPSFMQRVKESKVTDLVLIIGIVALLAIGIIASCGILNSMGAAQAVYLSYGMYAGAAAIFILLIIKCALNHCSKPKSNDTTDEKRENNNPRTNQTNTSQNDEIHKQRKQIIETQINQELLAEREKEKAIKKELNEKIQKLKIESSSSSLNQSESQFKCTVTLSTGESYSADLSKAQINTLRDALEDNHKIEYGRNDSGPISAYDLQTNQTCYTNALGVLAQLALKSKQAQEKEWLERIQKMTINYVSGNIGNGCPFMCTVILKTGESYTAELPREEIDRLYRALKYENQHDKIDYGMHWNGQRQLLHDDMMSGLSSKLDVLEILSKLMDKNNKHL